MRPMWRHAPRLTRGVGDDAVCRHLAGMTDYPPQAFLRHISACNNAVLPGRRHRVTLGGRNIGFALPVHAPAGPLADRAALDAHVGHLARTGAFRPRHESFDVPDEDTGNVLASIDRGAIPLLGTLAYGVHMNGLVRRPDGIHLWVAERARSKLLDPGKLDHIVAGGVPAGLDARQTLLKEATEEASLPANLTSRADHTTTLTYAMDRAEGLRRDRIYVFDLWLPDDIIPIPNDDEVAGFSLWPIHQVLDRVALSDDFKFNVTLVLIDLFLRLGIIDPASQSGRRVHDGLTTVRQHVGGVWQTASS